MPVLRASLVAVAMLAVPATAVADSFGGFSGVDRPYLVNQDRVCTPLAVTDGAATGAPACEKAGADVVAKLSIKNPVVQRGAKAAFAATARGRTMTVTKVIAGAVGDAVVTWTAVDPIGKIVDVYTSPYSDRVAVAFTVRRMGREVTDVVAFDLGKGSGGDPTPPTGTPPTGTPPTGTPVVAPANPAVTKAVAAARKASRAKQLAAWQQVIALAPAHAEAHYRIAIAQLGKKARADALASIATLAASKDPEAIEWLVEARFDKAFAPLRADAAFRTSVGLDRKAATAYERMMGFGGQWEQTGTSCDKPEVRMTVARDRVVRLRVKTRCDGRVFDLPFKGTWRLDGDRVVLTFPTRGKAASPEDEAPCRFEAAGDEDALHCTVGRDLDFIVLPTRR